MEKTTQSIKNTNQSLNEAVQSLEKNIEKNNEAVQSIRENKVDKKELADRFSSVDESLAAVTRDMQTLSGQVEQIDKNFKNELKALTDYLATEKKRVNEVIQASKSLSELLGAFQSDFKDFSKGTRNFVTEDELPLQIEKARLKLKVELDEAVRKMENRVRSLEKKIDAYQTPPPRVQPGQIIERNLQ